MKVFTKIANFVFTANVARFLFPFFKLVCCLSNSCEFDFKKVNNKEATCLS